MNEASFSKLTSDKYSQVHSSLCGGKAREKGDLLRGQKKKLHITIEFPFFSIIP